MSDVVSANQEHFNKLAADYDTRYKETLGAIESELKKQVDFIGIHNGARLLDYACGTGLLSRTFQDRISQSVGVDVSESMVEMYNANAKVKGSEDIQHAYFGNLIDAADAAGPASLSAPEFFNFDAAGVGLGFHHFEDTTLAATRLAERLKSGGTLFILDFLPHAPPEQTQDFRHSVAHFGFNEDNVKEMFTKAGAGKDFGFKKLDTIFKMERGGQIVERKCFLARGTKA